MSELAKEKLYRKELIAGGATGNNNLERIRSLASGGKGGFNYELTEFEYNVQGFYGKCHGTLGRKTVAVCGFDYNGNATNQAVKIGINDDENWNLTGTQISNVNIPALTMASYFEWGGFLFIYGGRIDNSPSTPATKYYVIRLSDYIACEFDINANYVPLNAKAVVLGDTVYFIGGYDTNSNNEYEIRYTEIIFDENEGFPCLNVGNLNYIHPSLANFYFGDCGAEIVGSKVYVFGGYDNVGETIRGKKIYSIELQSESGNTDIDAPILLEDELPVGVDGLSSVSYGDDIILIGGRVETGASNQLLRFNAREKKIYQLDNSNLGNCYKTCLIQDGANIYIMSGDTSTGRGSGKTYKLKIK